MSGGARRWTLTLTCLLLAAVVLMFPQRADAQVLYGSILGDVKDASGAVMPGATVVATNKSTGLTREAVTDEGGRYNLANLPAGVYSFKATQQGFKAFEQTEVTVSLNSVTRLDVSLEIGAMGDNVTVNAEAPVLQTDTAEVHQSLEAKDLANLPVPLGRNYQQVYRMLPGFAPPTNSHSIPTNPARSLEFTVNGTSDDQNNTRIDGVSTTHVQLPHVVSYIPTLESIQEVNVVTNSMDAEQGLAGGAAVNVSTKSGTNSIRGSAFEYFTNQHLKAWPMRFDDAALNTGDKPKMSYDEFGGTVGGPIQKNKIFYFVSYESIRDHKTVDNTVTVPLPAMLRGDLQLSPTPIYDPLTGNADGTGRTQFQVSPGDPNFALCNTATNPNCLNIIPAARMDPIARKIHSREQSEQGARQLFRIRALHLRSPPGGFEGRLQRQFQVESGRHLRPSPLPHKRADGVRRHCGRNADRRKQQPWARFRQHLPVYGDGHVHLQPHLPDGRALRVRAAGDIVRTARTRD
jgi:hypothetical protein